MKRYWIILALCFACQPAFAYDDITVSRVDRVVDGDTIVVDMDWLPAVFGDKMKVRIAEIDTPEMKGHCAEEIQAAKKAKAFLESQFSYIANPPIVRLKNVKRGSFFRIVADVEVDGVDIGTLMLKNGYARKYDKSEGRKPWCDLEDGE